MRLIAAVHLWDFRRLGADRSLSVQYGVSLMQRGRRKSLYMFSRKILRTGASSRRNRVSAAT
jgi:hypothetical protein